MPCVSEDGTLTDAARTILEAIKAPKTHQETASLTSLPLFRVRASVREMIEADMIVQTETGVLSMTEKGLEVLNLG